MTLPNGNTPDERRPNAAQQHALNDTGVSANRFDLRLEHLSSRTVAMAIIAALWTMVFLAFSAEQLMSAPAGAWSFVVPRAISSVAGAVISFGIFVVLRHMGNRTLAVRAFAALGLAIAGTALLAAANYRIFLPFLPANLDPSPVWIAFAADFLSRLWIFGSISGIVLALTYVSDIREREDRINALQALAHDAQIRALRNQLNPHFLFNALNSIAGLLSRGRGREAEEMTENLADFLRATLTLDPRRPITLADETRLQELYLAIEIVRFPDRLKVTVEIPDDLRDVLVPSLITQPLIENSIKYAVAGSISPVELRITANAEGDRLALTIEDCGGDSERSVTKGSSLGLANVAERIKAHFGERAELEVGALPGGGFRNRLLVPIARQ